MIRPPLWSILFPYTTLFRSGGAGGEAIGFALRAGTRLGAVWGVEVEFARPSSIEDDNERGVVPLSFTQLLPSSSDRKSTRLNSSHSQISYAVFCLKKKKTQF